MRGLTIAAAMVLCACGPPTGAGAIPEYGYEVVRVYPHDRTAYTEGLFYLDGFLYEGTGEYGESNIRRVKLETGEVLQKQDLPDTYFGEGIIKWGDEMIELEYKTGTGFIYDFNTFNLRSQFHYPPEGWSLTTDGKRIIMDDGSAQIRFWDPKSLSETGRLTVTDQGQPVEHLNELEWVKGEIFANIWLTDKIARIDPVSGKVTGWIDCTGLLSPGDRIEGGPKPTDVLNGIAYDAKGDRLFVTGKRWPKLFEIRLIKKTTC
jgi:glutamine cyclotransferase